jgi:tetraacyldisaccharide 4'-kinase
MYRRGWLRSTTLPAPVISVGNLAAGGTGKTPLVEHLALLLRRIGAHPVVLSRGYGRRTARPADAPRGGDLNDEGAVLLENLPWLPQRQDPDRARAGAAALAAGEGDCLLLDDGFQHLRLTRDLDIVTVDCARPFHSGLRREGPEALALAGVVVLTRAGRATDAERASAAAAVRRFAPGAALVVADHAPRDLVSLERGDTREPGTLRGRKVFAACGIADPAAFERTLRDLGAEVVGSRHFPDHRMEGAAALAEVRSLAARAAADDVVITQKDAVQLPRTQQATGVPVSILRVGLEVLEGAEGLETAVRDALDAGRRRSSGPARAEREFPPMSL